MKTVLDEFHASFLHAAIYADGNLRIIVAEGFRAAEPEDFIIGGHVIKDTYALNTSEESRLVEVLFTRSRGSWSMSLSRHSVNARCATTSSPCKY